jgi:hypothetical protein
MDQELTYSIQFQHRLIFLDLPDGMLQNVVLSYVWKNWSWEPLQIVAFVIQNSDHGSPSD